MDTRNTEIAGNSCLDASKKLQHAVTHYGVTEIYCHAQRF
jgi:hypothetical protein